MVAKASALWNDSVVHSDDDKNNDESFAHKQQRRPSEQQS